VAGVAKGGWGEGTTEGADGAAKMYVAALAVPVAQRFPRGGPASGRKASQQAL